MNNSTDILNELKSISPLIAGIEKINVFSVPEGYFDKLAEKITLYSLLNKNEDTNTEAFSVPPLGVGALPEGYFDTLSDKILAKIKVNEIGNNDQELQKLFPLLNSLKDKNVFTVPHGYFENLSVNVINKINPKIAKVISINKARLWWKYAAAAVITGAIAISSLQIFNSSPDVRKNNSVVTESSGLPDYIKSSFQYKTPEQVDEGISTLSDDAIANYLEKHASIMDNETLSDNIDVKELPDVTDYLTDENALNNYLKTIDAGSSDKK
ncbi:MAG: hypothetical protein M3Z26_04345 [Bacteroidota bacterium]|nr:hypothetical protein [Bacteroidota bacterium]